MFGCHLVTFRFGLLIGGLVLCSAAPLRADTAASDEAIGSLVDEDPRLSEMLARDAALLELLRGQPEMAARLAVAPSFMDRFLETMTQPWVLFGFLAQCCFMMRFLVQWIASEKLQRSHVPVAFWYFSLAGGVMLLTYAIQRRDPVFVFGQSLGLVIYLRNLVLIYKRSGARKVLLATRSARDAELPGAVEAAPVGNIELPSAS